MTPSAFLRRVLLADAAVSGAIGLSLAVAAAPLHELLGVPMLLLRVAGLVLLPYALALALLARRATQPTPAIWSVIAANVLWTLASVLSLLAGTLQPNALGYAFVAGQALVVAAFAELQYAGLRKADAVAA